LSILLKKKGARMSEYVKTLIEINGLITKNKVPKMDNSNLIDKDHILALVENLKRYILKECSFKERGEDD